MDGWARCSGALFRPPWIWESRLLIQVLSGRASCSALLSTAGMNGIALSSTGQSSRAMASSKRSRTES